MKRLTYSNSMQKRRHRHKLILPLWCILLLVTGCGNLYTGDESLYDPNHQDNQGDQTQLPVMVAFSDPIYNVLTRGAGVLDPTDETNFSKRIADGTFFVYAFRRDNPNGMTYAHRRAEDADRRYCLIDGSLDEISAEECTALGLTAEQCKLHGKRAAYAGNGSFINWKSSGYIPYYNLQEEFDAFNFFAYYYDNAQVGEVKREADHICFDVTVDGSFFRIRNVSLAYNFDKALISKIGMQALKLYVNIQNLKTWKHNTGYTPELGGSAIAFGVDDGSYPMPAIYTFGFNLTF